MKIVQKINFKIKNSKSEGKTMPKTVNRVSLGAVHTHTHTCISREIKRVANEATLCCVKDRVFVALYEEKNKVLEIACFLSFKKLRLMRKFYTKLKIARQYEIVEQGGVE